MNNSCSYIQKWTVKRNECWRFNIEQLLCGIHFRSLNRTVLPSVSLEIFQFDSQYVFVVAGQHVNIFVAHPKFFSGVAESVFIIGPVPIEIFAYRIGNIVSSLYHLQKKKKKYYIHTSMCIHIIYYVCIKNKTSTVVKYQLLYPIDL